MSPVAPSDMSLPPDAASSGPPSPPPLIPHQQGVPDHDRIIHIEGAVNAMAAGFGARLQQGAATMGELRNSIAAVAVDFKKDMARLEQLFTPKPPRELSVWEKLAAAAVAVGLIGGIIYGAGRLPSREDHDKEVAEAAAFRIEVIKFEAKTQTILDYYERRIEALEARKP